MKLALKLNSSWQTRRALDDRRLWLLGSIAVRSQPGTALEWGFEIFWKRLLAASAVLLVAGYLAAVTALYFWLSRQPGNQVAWRHVALAPVRWEELRRKRGDSAIATALQRLQAKDYVEAYYGLRVGLARSPANTHGRVTLAGLLLGSDPAGALKIAEDGLKYSPDDPELLRTLFNFYTLLGSGARAREVSARELARTTPLSAPARQLLAAEYAASFLAAGDPASALRTLDELAAAGVAADEAISRVRAFALVGLRRFDEARALMREMPRSVPANRRLEAELAIATGDATALESLLRQMRAEDGDRPVPLLFALRAWHRMGRATLRDRAEEEYLQQFGANDGALQMLAALAVELDLPAIIVRAQTSATNNRLNPFAFRLHLVEVSIRRGEFDEAFRRLRDIESTIPTLSPSQRSYPEFIQRIARACVAGGEQQTPALLAQLAEMRGRARPAMYLLAADSMRRAGFRDGAAQIVTQGLRAYPYHDELLVRQRDLAAVARLEAAKTAAAPREEERPAPVPVPATADAAFATLDAALARGEFTAMRDLQRAIRVAAPAWLPTAENGLARREVEAVLATQDAITARAFTHAYLQRTRPVADLAHLAGLARDRAAQGRIADARWLKEELEAAGASGAAAQILRALQLPDELAPALASVEAFTAAFDEQLRAGQPAEALRLLEQVRKREPVWLTAARNDLLAREVRARFAADQRLLALAAFKELVVRSGASRSAAFKLVRDLAADEEPERARELALEVKRLLPGDKAAAALLREIQSPSPTGN